MGNDFGKRLDEALEICRYGYFNNSFNLLYPFTTENISNYLPLFDLKDKSLLTVGSSCDQAFNAILCGSNNITIFDICPYIKEYYYLKKAAIEKFSKDEFLEFFCYKHYPKGFDYNPQAFNKDLYLSLRNIIKDNDYESYMFWDKLFSEFNGLEIRSQLFNHDEYNKDIICSVNDYLKNDSQYERLRHILNSVKVEFNVGNIFDDNIYGKYDNIFLSNLSAYYSKEQSLQLFNKLLALLNDNGTMLVSYIYYAFKLFWNCFDLCEELDDVSLHSFIGMKGILFREENFIDNVLIYKKVLKNE